MTTVDDTTVLFSRRDLEGAVRVVVVFEPEELHHTTTRDPHWRICKVGRAVDVQVLPQD